jgi:hypothetical protein
VGYLQLGAGAFGNLDRLVDRLQQQVGFGTHVGGVKPSMAGYRPAKLDQLLAWNGRAGWVSQAGAEADGPFVQRLLQGLEHFLHFGGRCSARFVAADARMKRVVPDEQGGVDCGTRLRITLAVIGNGAPRLEGRRHASGATSLLPASCFLTHGFKLGHPVRGHFVVAVKRGGGCAAIAADLGGNALVDLGCGGGLDE